MNESVCMYAFYCAEEDAAPTFEEFLTLPAYEMLG